MARAVLNPGQVLEGKYRIEKELDQGGMGQVYRAKHLGLQKDFALKTLSQLSLEQAQQAGFAEQFAFEAKTLASLDHPGLTRVVDLFHDEKTSYLVMELVEGITLTRMVEDSLNPLSQESVQRLAAQALDVLEYLHAAEPPVIVRDIKPDNMMITPQGRLKLIDFGLAKRLVAGQDTDSIVRGMGTDCYAPMEQYGEGVTDQRSDLFALGSTLYFALTGQPPPPVWKRVSLQAPLPHPAEHNPTVTEAFWSGLQTLLEVDMKGRPASAAEAKEKLLLGSDVAAGHVASKTTLLAVAQNTEYRLASAAAYYPFQPGDWILKVMQAATVAQAREVRVIQSRSVCKVALAIPAHALPDAGAIMEALASETDVGPLWLRELVLGLKMVGEFRDFRLLVDNWRRAWKIVAIGGSLQAVPEASQGKAGLTLEVDYLGKGADRARQAADELVALVRRTRMCPYPLYVDDRRIRQERPIERPLFQGVVREVYLASVSMPADGQVQMETAATEPESFGEEEAWTRFAPHDGRPFDSHLDVRCFLEASSASVSKTTLASFAFVRQPLRLLWYRHGILCGQQNVAGPQSLEVMAHLEGSYLPLQDAAGLSLVPADLLFPGQHKALVGLDKILPIVRAALESYQPPKPSAASSVGKVAAGLVAAPLLVLLLGAAAGPVVLKSALAGGLLQKAAALGGVAGYFHYDREEEALRNACLKAIDAYRSKP